MAMNFFSSLDIGASAMSAERFKMDVISQNIANANTQNTLSGTPYRRQVAMIGSDSDTGGKPFALPVGLDDDDDSGPNFTGHGVKVQGVAQDQSDYRYVYDPTNPNAVKDGKWKGYVAMPNVNIITEMTDLIAASRAYEASATAVEAAKGIAMKGLEISAGR
jgi:flagellar basal-body rod protein FlgC